MDVVEPNAGLIALGLAILLMLIPIVNIVIEIIVLNGISKNFGKDAAFTVGLFFLSFIFFPILGFGKAQYVGDKSNFA